MPRFFYFIDTYLSIFKLKKSIVLDRFSSIEKLGLPHKGEMDDGELKTEHCSPE